MPDLRPIYTPGNCSLAYKLLWTLSIFWRVTPLPPDRWLGELMTPTENDGVRILEHRLKNPATSQFLLSTTPAVSPSQIVRSVKGRLQHQIRDDEPRAFRGNYSVKSVGELKIDVVQRYLASQLRHHRMSDPAADALLRAYAVEDAEVDLAAVRRSSHGEFCFNLHIVFVHSERWREVSADGLSRSRDAILDTASKKKHMLSHAEFLADHLHLTLGCCVTESPLEVALGYLNNIAFRWGMTRIYQYGFYVGTVGAYDLGAVRQAYR